jgi:hypothetical protein
MMGAYHVDDVMDQDQPDDQQPPPPADAQGYTTEPDPSATFATEADPQRNVMSSDFKAKDLDWWNLAKKAATAVGEQVNPMPVLRMMYDDTAGQFGRAFQDFQEGKFVKGTGALMGAMDPVAAGTRAVTSAATGAASMSWEQFKKAKEAYDKGRYSEALGHTVAGVVPIAGPIVAGAAEEIGTADPEQMAHGTGTLAGAAAPMAVTKGASVVAEKLAPYVERIAEQKATHAIAPELGAKRAMYVSKAMKPEVQEEVMRGDAFKGVRNEDTAYKIAKDRKTAANDALKAAYDKIPDTQQFATAPLLQRLDAAIRRLTPVGSSGKAVESAPVTERLAALRQARQDVQNLGTSANADAMRVLRQNWDTGAEAALSPPNPAAPASAISMQGKFGWADARSVLQGYLDEQAPQLKPFNADYSLWKNIHDVLRARVNTETARATVGRGLVGALGGMEIGAHTAGLPGMVMGWITGKVLPSLVHETGYTGKIAQARAFAKLADALESGHGAMITSAARSLAIATGTSKQLEEALRKARGEPPPQ